MNNSSNSIVIFDSEVVDPIVTIAIPTYMRGDKLLIESIESSLNQVDFFLPYEVLVVDNNPIRNDRTEKGMAHYKDTGKIAYYKNEENIGPIGNWNRLYELAKGKYVVMLHDDDMLFPYYLKVMFSLLEETKNQFELVYPSYYITKERAFPEKELPQQLSYRIFKREDYIVTQWGLPSGMMILKEKFSQIGGYSMDLYPINDQEFIYRALGYLKGCVIYFPLVLYYLGENTSMQSNVIIKSVVNARKFNYLIRKDKLNHWRYFAKFSYRDQIANQIRWGMNFVTDDVIDEAKKRIEFKNNYIKGKLSSLFVRLLKDYLNRVRIHTFTVTDQIK
jgi:glycosyltransferase involved in cell wall biosynthesis